MPNSVGHEQVTKFGVLSPGGYADHVLAPHSKYLVDFAGIPEHYACTLACAGITEDSALKKVHPLSADDKVVIIGAGGVGLTGVGVARAYLRWARRRALAFRVVNTEQMTQLLMRGGVPPQKIGVLPALPARWVQFAFRVTGGTKNAAERGAAAVLVGTRTSTRC